ncbi:Protein N-acetyltransferase, RimJ/RimL family [Lentibacillus halodurans]|uniref:Protein N-acetyltransferase, RimJ/RimL family n=1 Tax=Lentibacillus halodurans TaxID=237679 RepID=A0A1I0Y5E2_9BACI|nr:GNAT family N-acetyltransferase [Lentibacillus halodurans]SFB08067.1 Protein N-acetyltransferase, RimJ/RimL family [Lentibacillus halodurans]
MLGAFETDRLILRERTFKDFECCVKMDCEPEVVNYIPELKKIINGTSASEKSHREFVKKRFETDYPEGMGYWTIVAKEEPQQFVGWVLLIPLDTVGPEIEIGWRLRPKYWGKGYATEAARVIIQYAVESLNLQEVIAEIHKMNTGSIRVAEKIGMEYAGTEDTNDYIRYALNRSY